MILMPPLVPRYIYVVGAPINLSEPLQNQCASYNVTTYRIHSKDFTPTMHLYIIIKRRGGCRFILLV